MRNQSFYMTANENFKPKSMECWPSGTRREAIPAGQSAVKTTRKEFSSLSVRPQRLRRSFESAALYRLATACSSPLGLLSTVTFGIIREAFPVCCTHIPTLASPCTATPHPTLSPSPAIIAWRETPNDVNKVSSCFNRHTFSQKATRTSSVTPPSFSPSLFLEIHECILAWIFCI